MWLQKVETMKLTCARWVVSQGYTAKEKNVLFGEQTFEHRDFPSYNPDKYALTLCMMNSRKPASIRVHHQWLPWGSSGLESTCQCRGHGFDPWSGKIPHVMGELSP